jgi:outer membrane receptor protein involved in Fe transport
LKINGDIYEIPTYNYFDVSATYLLTKNYQIVAGINNIFDKEPPLAAGSQINDYGTGFYGTYDPLGRYLFTGVQVTF